MQRSVPSKSLWEKIIRRGLRRIQTKRTQPMMMQRPCLP